MIEDLLDLPSHLRARLASALETGVLVAPYSLTSLRGVLEEASWENRIVAPLNDLASRGVSGEAAAQWIRSLERVASRAAKPDLVWSGPEVPGIHARDTRAVYEELLGSVVQSVWVSTYVFFDGPKAFEVLAHRMDETPNLSARLLLNIQRKWEDSTKPELLVRKFADKFWSTDWPGSTRPAVYYDPRSIELERPSGILHAKAVVADEESVFVTSANLTEAALDRNFEVGILVRDRTLALTLSSHFQGLIDKELLVPLPAS
jgi:phosphatidylserine/phosphatidylglycerophosphate/cardiolipin synthase-like enzyme